MITISSLLGVVMYGYYAPMNCDPLKSGRVTDPNQVIITNSINEYSIKN